MTSRTFVEVEATDRLAELGLTVELLERVIRRADAEARTCTPLDPPNLTGFLRWGRTARFLREELVPFGWGFDNPRNLPRTIHPSGDFAIVTTSGDGATGVVGFTPTTKYPKGVATVEAVESNLQLALEFGDEVFDVPGAQGAADNDNLMTWILLFHVAENEIRVELSLPDSMIDGQIASWAERIILPALAYDDDPFADLGRPDDGEDEVVVEVNRR